MRSRGRWAPRRAARRLRRRQRAARLPLPGRSRLLRRERDPVAALSPLAPLEPARAPGTGEEVRARFGLRLSLVALAVTALFAALVVRLWTLQVIDGPRYFSLAEATTTRDVPVAPPRGEILARGGQVLARDVSTEAVTVDPQTLAVHPEVVPRVAALLGVSASFIRQRLEAAQRGLDNLSPFVPVPIATNVSAQTVAVIAEHRSQFPGVTASPLYERSYPYRDLAAQVIGYVGAITPAELNGYAKLGYTRADVAASVITPAELNGYAKLGYTENDQVGQTGLEAEYELALRGRPGVDEVAVDPAGNVVRTVGHVPPRPGDDVVLNLDLGLEQALSSALEQEILAVRQGLTTPGGAPAPSGAGVVLDARTGAVLAMASYPSYDNNEWVNGISESAYAALTHELGYPLNNYAVQSPQPPGSTFKLATATAALDDGLISPSYYYDDTGSFTLGNLTLHDAGGEVLGEVNITSALAESSDDFFYNLGWMFWQQASRFGITPIQDMAARYGFGTPSGVDLPGVNNGQVDSPALRKILHREAPAVYPDTYYPADNVEMAFGQGFTEITPLELADAYATFANGGTRWRPELAAAIVSPSGKLLRRIRPVVEGHVRFASASDYDAMLHGFEGAVQSPTGTAYGAFQGFDFARWNVAGKTGTASASPSVQPTSWFVGFGGPRNAPPRYVVAVQIDQAGYGASAAAPVVRKVFDYLVSHGVAPLRLAP
ncbi:MAG TPA: penicillin-binding protein 2 [Acidimicrobiales bacterium]|nr:penicillin-binding protein 2 [Acidimicrobiales bacterium]